MQENRSGDRMAAAAGRSGRLDMSGLTGTELSDQEGDDEVEGQAWTVQEACDWCGQPRGSGYVVVAQERCDGVCPICWGRSPDYLELRGEGLAHEAALDRLGTVPQ